MAAKFPLASDAELAPREEQDKTWLCDDHAKPVKFYCRGHKLPLCQQCSTKDHTRKPCHLDNIEDVVSEMRSKLDDKLLELAEKMKTLKAVGSQIESCSNYVSNHMKTVNEEIIIAFEKKRKDVQKREREDILRINKEADEEIRLIEEERERRIQLCIEEAQRKEQEIRENHEKPIPDVKKMERKR